MQKVLWKSKYLLKLLEINSVGKKNEYLSIFLDIFYGLICILVDHIDLALINQWCILTRGGIFFLLFSVKSERKLATELVEANIESKREALLYIYTRLVIVNLEVLDQGRVDIEFVFFWVFEKLDEPEKSKMSQRKEKIKLYLWCLLNSKSTTIERTELKSMPTATWLSKTVKFYFAKNNFVHDFSLLNNMCYFYVVYYWADVVFYLMCSKKNPPIVINSAQTIAFFIYKTNKMLLILFHKLYTSAARKHHRTPTCAVNCNHTYARCIYVYLNFSIIHFLFSPLICDFLCCSFNFFFCENKI